MISRNRAIKLVYGVSPKKQKKSKRRGIKFRPPGGFDKDKLQRLGSKMERLKMLREWADVRVNNPVDPETVRRQFIDGWQSRDPASSKFCFCCREEKADCYHHAVQVQNGGGNENHNLVPVCDKCHERIHPWLKDNHRPDVARVVRQGGISRAHPAAS